MESQLIETETYAIISNLDWTITKINPIIEEFGYVFIPISLQKLENDFSEVFHISREYKPKQGVLKSFEAEISNQFESALNYYFRLHPGDEDIAPDHEVYLLKLIEKYNTEKHENWTDVSLIYNEQFKISKFAIDLIRVLRLYKKGQIDLQGYFSIFTSNRHVITKHKTTAIPTWGYYSIEDRDIEIIHKLLNNKVEIPPFIKLAIESFEVSYEIVNNKLKFIQLMICLEILFNRSSNEPISHIISRHLSLLLAQNKKEFDDLIKRTKELYNTRSKIVHGEVTPNMVKKLNKSIVNELYELEEITRRVLCKLLWENNLGIIELDKVSLFHYLNGKGF